MHDKIQRYSLRKLSVGLASVMVGACIFSVNGKTVKADVTSDQTTQATNVQGQTATTQSQNEKQQGQSNVAQPQENKNLLDDLGKQKASTDNNQAEAQENRLVDQINYKLTNNGSTDNKEELGQNLTAPDETKQAPTTKNDAEKSIVSSSSTQQVNNQSNDHANDNSQTRPQNRQKLDLTKNSKKLAKKVLATNLIATSPMTNGGFDEATWGKLDVNNWYGYVQDGVYELTSYAGDSNHIIVPNAADFEKAGKSTNGLQVGITKDTANSLFVGHQGQTTIAFSKTNNQKVKAIGTDWSYAFYGRTLGKFDGSNLDVSNVTNMSKMFEHNSISNLTGLDNWDTSNVTNMSEMFEHNSISNLTGLDNWDTSNVTNMSEMFSSNSISNLTSLAHWNTSSVTNMSWMFDHNSISDLTGLDNWDTSNVTNMSEMFSSNSISNLTSLAHWNTSNVADMSNMFEYNSISDLTGLAHWNTSNVADMSNMFEYNSISDLTGLAHWNTSNVADMSNMFEYNSISDLTGLAHWDTSNVTDMRDMFASNKISDLTPLTNWNTSKVTNISAMFAFDPDIIDLRPIANWDISSVNIGYGFLGYDTKINLTNINNTPLMQGFLKEPDALKGATFITNNADLVKATTGKDLPNLTNTAKRTITFNLPHAEPKTITQTIYYKAIAPVQISFDLNSDNGEIVKTYPVKESDWQLDTSKKNDDVIIDGVICFKPVKIPHVNGYKAHLIKDPVNPTAFLVSFMAVPKQPQNNQSNNFQSSQKTTQTEQKQPEPIQTQLAEQEDKQIDQLVRTISYALMHNDSTSDNADSFEPAQNNFDQLKTGSDSTQKDDGAKPQKVNAAKHKKHIAKKRVAKRHKKHAKKYHLKRRSRKHSKRSKKRIIKRRRTSKKFKKYSLKKHIKRV